jgi:transposase
MQFSEEKAREIQEKHGLSESVIKLWRHRKSIPNMYEKKTETAVQVASAIPVIVNDKIKETKTRWIFRVLAAFNLTLHLIPRDDAYQEIRIAQLLSEEGKELKTAQRLLYNLCKDFGFRKSAGGKHDSQIAKSVSSLNDEDEKIVSSVLDYYQSHTARETCEKFGIKYSQKIAKILNSCHQKGMGKGGARKGAGRKIKNN